jgi:hypothetical protein
MENPEASVWVEDWTDDKRRERYQFYAQEMYETYKAHREFTQRCHTEYAKWLLASGLAVHGGAIYALNGLRSSAQTAHLDGLLNSASWNLAGVVFVLLAGVCAWINLQAAEHIYGKWANPLFVFKTDAWPTDEPKTDLVNAMMFLAAAFGLLSGFCFIVSAVNLVQVLRTH